MFTLTDGGRHGWFVVQSRVSRETRFWTVYATRQDHLKESIVLPPRPSEAVEALLAQAR